MKKKYYFLEKEKIKLKIIKLIFFPQSKKMSDIKGDNSNQNFQHVSPSIKKTKDFVEKSSEKSEFTFKLSNSQTNSPIEFPKNLNFSYLPGNYFFLNSLNQNFLKILIENLPI